MADMEVAVQKVYASILEELRDPNMRRQATGLDFTGDAKPQDTYDFIKPKQFDLQDRSVLITGASKGVGEACAISYARAGCCNIAIAARSPLESVEKAILDAAAKAGRPVPKVLKCKVDVTNKKDVQHAAEQVRDAFGSLDILINNAGYMEKFTNILETDPDDWWHTWNVNINGTFLVTKSFLPLLLDKKDGLKTIVNVSSLIAHTPSPGGSAYQSSKFALIHLTQQMNLEYADQGLLVFAWHPCNNATELATGLTPVLQTFLVDTVQLAGDTCVWLTAERREWLRSRYISSQWDMAKLEQMKDEIVDENLLRVRLAVGGRLDGK